MLDPAETHRMADLLIREYRHDAARQAINRMYASFATGDWDGERAWRRVLLTIDRLQAPPATRLPARGAAAGAMP